MAGLVRRLLAVAFLVLLVSACVAKDKPQLERTRDVIYGRKFGLALTMDVFTPQKPNGLLIIPGNEFSRHDTHFRLSFAADERTLARGVEMLRRLA